MSATTHGLSYTDPHLMVLANFDHDGNKDHLHMEA
jgi:hypothetical protein